MQCVHQWKFCRPQTPKVSCRNSKAAEICFHPRHPSIERKEIFLIWNYEVFQETIEEVLISKMFLIILRAIKATFGYSMFRTTLN